MVGFVRRDRTALQDAARGVVVPVAEVATEGAPDLFEDPDADSGRVAIDGFEAANTDSASFAKVVRHWCPIARRAWATASASRFRAASE